MKRTVVFLKHFRFRGIELDVICVLVKEKNISEHAKMVSVNNLPVHKIEEAEGIAETYAKERRLEDYSNMDGISIL